jgi:hypothetical protein
MPSKLIFGFLLGCIPMMYYTNKRLIRIFGTQINIIQFHLKYNLTND